MAGSAITAGFQSQQIQSLFPRGFADPGTGKQVVQPTGSVLGATTGPIFTPENREDFRENIGDAGQQEQFDLIDQSLATAFSALDKFGATLGPTAATQTKQAEASAASTIGEAGEEQESRLGTLGRQETKETQKSAFAEAGTRRQVMELLKGRQAQFGGATGTGAFASEIVGAEGVRTIGSIRIGLQNAVGEIRAQEQNVQNIFTRIKADAKTNLDLAKERIQNELQRALADIAGRKGELEATKAQLKVGVIQNAQALIADINARNVAFEQELFLRERDVADKLALAKQQVVPNIEAIFKSFSDAGVKVEGQSLGSVGLDKSKGISSFTLQQPKEDEDNPKNPFE